MDSENTNVGLPATMLVGPATLGAQNAAMPYPIYMGGGSGGNSGGMGGFGGDGWGIIVIILILAALGGFGNNGGGNGSGGFLGNVGGGIGSDFPWLMNGQQSINNNVSDGFRDAQLHDSVTSVRDGVSNLATQLCDCCGQTQMSIANSTAALQNSLCNGFSGVNATINGAQNAISNQLYNNEIASLNRSFAEQTANTAGFNGVQSSLCDIRYGNATNTRDIIESQTRGTQAILDKLCALEIDGYKRENDQLRTQLNMAALNASQTAQTAELRQSGATQLNQLVSELRSCPIPAQPVYGNQPIFQCSGPAWNNNGCGCGCNGNNF